MFIIKYAYAAEIYNLKILNSILNDIICEGYILAKYFLPLCNNLTVPFFPFSFLPSLLPSLTSPWPFFFPSFFNPCGFVLYFGCAGF